MYAQINAKTEILGIQGELVDAKEKNLDRTQRTIMIGIAEHHSDVDDKFREMAKDVEDPTVAELDHVNSEELARMLQKFRRGNG